MKTILFLLQKSQFSAVIGNERCRFHGEESMSLSDSKPEKIVELFENNDDFKGWNDTKLFILYDSESAKYLFKIIEGFEIKRIAAECKNFSFQIKLEEKSIDLNDNVEELLKYLENGDAVVIAEKDKEILALKNEVDTLRKDGEQKESKINDLKEKIEGLNKELKQAEKKEKELKSKLSELEEAPLFIDRGDYIELSKPICNIRMIEKGAKSSVNYFEAEEYAKNLRLGGFDDWRIPNEKELRIIYKIKDFCGIEIYDSFFWTSWYSRTDKYQWRIYFGNGNGEPVEKFSNNCNVRCVR
ncbi:DUF1566 domain-containing protein [bacterium]|nr:DUF1566 domain-containing protein [bacterium]